jgi:hypothetical protein
MNLARRLWALERHGTGRSSPAFGLPPVGWAMGVRLVVALRCVRAVRAGGGHGAARGLVREVREAKHVQDCLAKHDDLPEVL